MAAKRPSGVFLPNYRIPKKAREEFDAHFDEVQQEEEERERREKEEKEEEERERKIKGQQLQRCTVNSRRWAPHSQIECSGWHSVNAASQDKVDFLSEMAAQKTEEERNREMEIAIKNAEEEMEILQRKIQGTQAFTRAERGRIGELARMREIEAHEFARFGTFARR